jgi:hypothetical protein
MRTTVNLDDDVHQILSVYALARGITMGAAIGEMVRQAESAAPEPPDIRRLANGFPCFPPTGRILTPEMVKEAESESE